MGEEGDRTEKKTKDHLRYVFENIVISAAKGIDARSKRA